MVAVNIAHVKKTRLDVNPIFLPHRPPTLCVEMDFKWTLVPKNVDYYTNIRLNITCVRLQWLRWLRFGVPRIVRIKTFSIHTVTWAPLCKVCISVSFSPIHSDFVRPSLIVFELEFNFNLHIEATSFF